MLRQALRFTLIFFVTLTVEPVGTSAQSLSERLSTLLTEQQTAAPAVTDEVARIATRDTLLQLLKTELGTLPIAASAGGFVYRLNPQLGVVQRASEGFGPFLTERTLTNSRGQTSIGVSVQLSTFGSLQGTSLTDGSFPTNAARNTGDVQPFSVDSLNLELEARSTIPFATHGVTDRLTLGVAVPLTAVRFSGQRTTTVNLFRTLRSRQSGSAYGLGDISMHGRYLVAGTGPQGFAIGADLRLPTGRVGDFLGSGRTSGRVLGITSWEEGPMAFHMNAGASVGGVSREVFWSTAAAFAVTPRVTFAAETMVRLTSELSRVSQVFQPSAEIPGIETMRWLEGDRGVRSSFFVVGAKWNVARSWLVNSGLLVRLTDTGLRSRVTPIISLDRAFQR